MTPDDLREWRERLGMTQAQAAAALGRSVEWVHSAETRRRPIERMVELSCWAVERQRAEAAKAVLAAYPRSPWGN